MKLTDRIKKLETKHAVDSANQITLFRVRVVAPGALDDPPGELQRIQAHGTEWQRADDESEDQFTERVFAASRTAAGNKPVFCIGRYAPANAPMNAGG